MMGSFLRKFLIVLLVGILYIPEEGHAFSFGEIKVHSAFGEKFDAVVEIRVPGTRLLHVSLGRAEEYKLLQLPRASIVNELKIVQPIQDLGDRKLIHLVSDRPLFFPSFHLILRASHDGDNIIKSYLIAVDFQQNLALSFKNKERSTKDNGSMKQRKKENKMQEETIAQTPIEQVVDDELRFIPAPSGFAVDPVMPAYKRHQTLPSSGTTWVSLRKKTPFYGDFSIEEKNVVVPRVVKEALDYFESESAPVPSVLAELGVRLAPSDQMVPPVSLKEVGGNLYSDRRLQALTNSSDQNAIRSLTKLEVEVVDKREGLSTKKTFAERLISKKSRAVHRGQTLMSIAQEVSLGKHSSAKIAVAIWLENQQKFIYGNINGVRVGTQFNMEGLIDRLATLDDQTSRAILKNQWWEWKIFKKSKHFVEEKSNLAIEEYPPPSQQVLDKEKLFLVLEDWKYTWEEGDDDGHIQHYFVPGNSEHGVGRLNLISQKKKMFQRYPDVRLDVGRSNLIVNGGKVWVSFSQYFSSQSMESMGRKELQMVLEDGEWKIHSERFKLKKFLEKDGLLASNVAIKSMGIDKENVASPYVIHVTTYLTQEDARNTINKLRKAGYDAYSATLRISSSKRIYRVYVGRYSSWEVARRLAMELRNYKVSENAIPSPHAWVIQVGSFLSSNDAEEKVDSMRTLGFSPFLFVVSDENFSFPMFRVYLGAFIKNNQARQMMEDLKQLGIPHTLVSP